MENFSDLGKYLRIPRHEIRYEGTNTDKVIISAIADKLSQSGRNILPVIVEQETDDSYKVLLNGDILAGAIEAKLDYVWCILADEERKKQIDIESKQKFEIDLLTASEDLIFEMIQYIIKLHDFKRIDAKKAAKLIVEKRSNWSKSNDLKVFTKLSSGIGEAKIPTFEKYFVIN
ncbi:hypothetical protein Syn7502_02284 [Synechococcus sp. PCC 7502]|uniref:hypothetical protein n=1 Tax=Synechococcus sp. PCC 7502 TaxID=1173263 RepID=UPI00029FE1D9|nr:hypothetical protein [Synechococcus sp. PCC 7502]AFY74289.1 hypothetical protein Syn7502_02284 [Synechococcus sp. PCC 7502]